MGAVLKSFLIGLYVLIRGRSSVTTTLVPKVYRYVHKHQGQELNVMCQQLRHRVVYERWFMLARTYRTYKVAVASVRDKDNTEWPGTFCDWPTAFYPEMTPWFMENTSYPYFQAINAYIDSVIEGIKEKRRML